MSDFRATPEELEQYRREGYFVRESQFSDAELEPLREAVDGVHDKIVEAARAEGGAGPDLIDGKRYEKLLDSSVQWEWRDDELAEIRSMEPYYHLDPRLECLIDDPRLWEASRAIVNSQEVSLFSDKLNFKRPQGAPFPWHQDNPYWAFSCDHLERLVSVSIYLDAATQENGCLWMIPGSQQYGALPCFEDRGDVGRLYTDVDRCDLDEPVAIEAPAGSLCFFGGDVVHGSMVNRSEGQRRVLLATYQPAGLPRWQHEDIRPIEASRVAS